MVLKSPRKIKDLLISQVPYRKLYITSFFLCILSFQSVTIAPEGSNGRLIVFFSPSLFTVVWVVGLFGLPDYRVGSPTLILHIFLFSRHAWGMAWGSFSGINTPSFVRGRQFGPDFCVYCGPVLGVLALDLLCGFTSLHARICRDCLRKAKYSFSGCV